MCLEEQEMGCQQFGICGTAQVRVSSRCLGAQHSPGPHQASTGHAGTATESKSPKSGVLGQEGTSSHPPPTHAMMPERWKSSAER